MLGAGPEFVQVPAVADPEALAERAVLAAGLDDVDAGALGQLAPQCHDEGASFDRHVDVPGSDAWSVELDDQLVAGAVDVVGQWRGHGFVDGRELLDLLYTEGTQGTEWIDDLRHGDPLPSARRVCPLRIPTIN